MLDERPSLGRLAWIVGRDANWTFGGGTPTMEVLRRSMMRRGWMTDDDHQRLFALSRLTPGTNLLAYCTATGWQARRWPGALVAWLASSAPASGIAVLATLLYSRLNQSAVFGGVVTLGMTVALALLLASAWRLARPHLRRDNLVRSTAIMTLVLILALLDITPIRVLLMATALGALWPPRT